MAQACKKQVGHAGSLFLVILVMMAIFGPMFSPYSVTKASFTEQNLPPSASHWFGTDDLGRDMYTRTWYGARISLFVGLMAALIDFIIGVIYGASQAIKEEKQIMS